MKAIEIKKNIYWVGAIDWNVRDFHGYETRRGTSYNAYLILDKKNVLIDTVKDSHTEEMMERIKSIIDPSRIDIVVSNHVEMDHSGGLPTIMKHAPNATLITSNSGLKGLQAHFDTEGWKMEAKGSGSTIEIGSRTIKFLHTPMVHWPDSMVSYIPEDKLLLPNDAMGQHYATSFLFDDQNPKDVIFEESAKYYANIVLPFGNQVKGVLKVLADLEIDMIAPSHGVVWRTHIPQIIKKYADWADHAHTEKAVVIYDSMWGSTEKIARNVKATFEKNDVPVVFRSLKTSHISDIIADILEAKYVAIGSPVLNNQVLPTVAALLTYIKGLKPKSKVGFAFGSFGWNHVAINDIESLMNDLKWTMPTPSVSVKYIPTKENISDIVEKIECLIKETKEV